MPSINRIQIEQQVATIGITTQQAQMKITMPKPTFKSSHDIPKPQIETTRSEFKIDWQKVRNETGLKSPNALAISQRDTAKAKTTQAIGSIVSKGEYVGNVEQPGERIAQLSHQGTIQDKRPDLNIGLAPQSSPDVQWDTADINIEWSKGGLVIEWDNEIMTPTIEVDPPYSVEIFLESKPYIRITVAEGEVSEAPGQLVDASV